MTAPLRLLADANIPFLHEAFGRYGTVRAVPGRLITRSALDDVDGLLVRSVTPVHEALLAGSPVRFVGTATAGIDHIDTAFLAQDGIGFASAPGSNAESVVEYVLAAVLALAVERGEGLRGTTMGVVGAGQVGRRLIPRAEAMGLRVLACDPPLAEAAEARGDAHSFVAFETVLAQSDIITLHTPLTHPGESAHPTHHLVNAETLAAMRPGAWLINAARGAVVDNTALYERVADGDLGGVVLDVWEGEPRPRTELGWLVDVATPHIAGYSFDGKVAGTVMLERALRRWLQTQGATVPPSWDAESVLAPTDDEPLVIEAPRVPAGLAPDEEVRWLDRLVRQAYALRTDDARFRDAVLGATPDGIGEAFADLRKRYPRRRAWTRYTVDGRVPDALVGAVTDGLGMRVRPLLG